jgi:hypothetical protein
MYTALYYPHTITKNTTLLKTALLLWDKLEFIVPDDHFPLKTRENVYDIDAALECIGVRHCPTPSEMGQAHEFITELVAEGLPHNFFSRRQVDDQYLIYPEKFLAGTWNFLHSLKLAELQSAGGSNLSGSDYYNDWTTSSNLGLAMMSILAEVCAGNEKRTFTDKISAYRLLNQSISRIHGGEFSNVSTPSAYEQLVTISLKIIDVEQFSIEELLTFRKNENKETRQFRHNYLKKIDEFVSRISKSNSDRSVSAIKTEFESEMKDDLEFLNDALKRNLTGVLLSEVAVGILAAVGASVTPLTIPAAIVGVFSLVKASINYKEERRKSLSSHAMAWLFSLKNQGPIQIY